MGITKGTIIYLENGFLREIENVCIGDMILQPSGTSQHVIDIKSTSREVIEIKQITNHRKLVEERAFRLLTTLLS